MIKGKIKIEIEPFKFLIKNAPLKYDNTPRLLIIDADSILYTSCYFPEDSIINLSTIEEKIDELKFRIRNKIQEIENNINEYYNIQKTLLFVKGKGNFRYKINPNYKSNRTPPNEFIPIALEYILNECGAIPSHNGEADDYVYDAMLDSKNNCVVSSIDKDVLYNCPDVPFYNYRSYGDVQGEFKTISHKQSRLAIASQVIIGDSTDGIKGAVKLGQAWCTKNLHEDMTNYQFIKNIFLGYIKSTNGNLAEAKKQIKFNFTLLKLYTINELKEFI